MSKGGNAFQFRLDVGWVNQSAFRSWPGRTGGPRLLNVSGAQDMKNRLARCDQVVSDDAPVTSPPHGFRAHHCAAQCVSQISQLGESGTEGAGHRVIGVVVKALVVPEGVYRRWGVPQLASKSSKRRDVDVTNLPGSQCLGQSVTVVLRVRPRSRNGSDVDDESNFCLPQQIDEIVD